MKMEKMQCDFRLAIVKGLVEHDDGTTYFGRLGGYMAHLRAAEEAGWVRRVEDRETLTEAGREVYTRCRLSTLPNLVGRRAYLWNWSEIPSPNL